MLFQLEQECLDIYKRKVEHTRKYKADLYKMLAEAESEFSRLASSIGEHRSFSRVCYLRHIKNWDLRGYFCHENDCFLIRKKGHSRNRYLL